MIIIVIIIVIKNGELVLNWLEIDNELLRVDNIE